ncbi:MAG: hypothetical protein EXQ53_02150 [Acidobacteria bacterium]|nr:hypothetical protein [Acidobacteriota bacterium]
MKSGVVRWLIVVAALLALPVAGYAQEATITGSVTDSTGGVLPGVTVTAVHEATGNTFVSVTDERGIYRIPARVGRYKLTAELSGFTTLTRSGVTLLIGQTANLALQMTVTGVAESVTVTGEAPLLNITQSTISGNIDPRQMQDLPIQGREWTSLALLAPGNRTNAAGATPIEDRGDVREFQLNMDGQQVTNNIGPGAQPRFSRDAVGEFQFISNRFDATQGRSSGVQVNAITRSGTNQFTGTLGGYFQDSDWNAADHVLNQVVPGSEQQYSTTFGGPILRDRLHFFSNYEYRRRPRTMIPNTFVPAFNAVTLSGTDTTKLATVRLDFQLSSANRLMVKGNTARVLEPFSDVGANHPANAGTLNESTNNMVLQLTSVMGNSSVNEVKFGPSSFKFGNKNLTTWSKHWLADRGITNGHPRIQFTGFNITGNNNWPRYQLQDIWSARDDFTLSINARGRHDLKLGGELLLAGMTSNNCARCMGNIVARGGPLPSVAQMTAWFPDAFNVDTWDLNKLNPIIQRYVIGISDAFAVRHSHPKSAGWLQDDWTVTDRLTLNLGLRYDLIWNATNQKQFYEPWMKEGRPQDADNIQPRLGFAYQVNDRTVVRGGAGLYYPDVIGSQFTHSNRFTKLVYVTLPNDGRPDFATNPFNGPTPTYSQAVARMCDVRNVPGCLRRDAEELAPPAEFASLTDTWQMSMGFQRQLRNDMAVEVDYVRNRSRNEKVLHSNVNLAYNPATGANYPFSNTATRVYPEWGAIGYYAYTGESDHHGLQTTFTKRFSDKWQFSANYTLSQIKNDEPSQPISGQTLVPFPVAADLGGEYGLAVTDQRHRAVFNGIWEVGHGFQLSGLYFYGAGQRQEIICGGDRRDVQGASPPARLCANGTIVPRNDFVQDPIHRIDMRLQERIPLGGKVSIDGILELFNLLDRANYQSYTLDQSSPRYGLPNQSTNLSYLPRTAQMGFRLTF